MHRHRYGLRTALPPYLFTIITASALSCAVFLVSSSSSNMLLNCSSAYRVCLCAALSCFSGFGFASNPWCSSQCGSSWCPASSSPSGVML